ncbi:hypothetical protein MSAN_02257900 [Mycena sanguinolenta]|uniref:Uncharacterized protein n=1 Tax=Mycena sanguinolenta TaxID=230812 RepID=A0A8H6XB96_9AGAR|nr:hypothetical protein MSAN_02257900 [Mycena sanguinolenta]
MRHASRLTLFALCHCQRQANALCGLPTRGSAAFDGQDAMLAACPIHERRRQSLFCHFLVLKLSRSVIQADCRLDLLPRQHLWRVRTGPFCQAQARIPPRYLVLLEWDASAWKASRFGEDQAGSAMIFATVCRTSMDSELGMALKHHEYAGRARPLIGLLIPARLNPPIGRRTRPHPIIVDRSPHLQEPPPLLVPKTDASRFSQGRT